ncbi:MAG: N-acetylmuramoyl-L-alanine amidase [Bacteroidetes bacterium]|nr:N-acetylmuramoyl-L-alanine amidase [Bacteroidota bacterium]MBU1800175.1 N-acetylmuramoyl-L-alanine amidase [Bacteroidota bacterium]
MIKSFTYKYHLALNAILFIIFSVFISAQEITHKKIEYSPLGNFSNMAPSEFLSDVIEIPIVKPEPFIAIGLNATLTSEKDKAQFFIRVSKDGNTWSDWELISNEDDAEKIENKFIGSLSFFDKENKFMQFHTNSLNYLDNLTFSFISPGKTTDAQIKNNIYQSQKIKLISNIERPEFVSRKSWGCPQDENVSTRSLTDVTHLIIHHSAAHTVSSDYAAVVRTYWDWHVNGNGWDDIGYNWLVDPNGVLYKGRAWISDTQENIIGAHNSGKNSGTVGICFIGNYVSDIPSDIGLNKVASIAAFLCDKYGIIPKGQSYHATISRVNDNISGHGQSGGGTACPGTQMINRMPLIRELTNSKILDITATPNVVTTYPNTEVDSAYHSKKAFIEFSHPMNKSSVESAFSITPNTFGEISWNSEGNILYFQPSPTFAKQTNYTIIINKNATSNWDVPLTEDIELNFVTKARDNLSLISYYPQDGDNNIELDTSISLQFDGALNSSSLVGNVILQDKDKNKIGIVVDASGYSDGIIKFTSQTQLDENSEYSIQLNEGISSTDNYSFGTNKTIYFTTKTTTSVKYFAHPETFNLISAYPNPFNPTTTIEYQLIKPSHVTINIYDIIGNVVTKLINKDMSSGSHKITFNANNLPSGVYFSQIITSSETKTIKLLLAK